MHFGFFQLIALHVILFSCNSTLPVSEPPIIQGHRGCRGLLPENTVEGFIHAIKTGVSTIELDVVVSKDSQIIVSHEPWFNHKISTHPDGIEINENNEKSFNIYQMTLEEIQKFDTGSKVHPQFPQQQTKKACKPTLRQLVTSLTKEFGDPYHKNIHYNIEIKFDPKLEGSFYPNPEVFADLVINEIQDLGIQSQCNIQSFSPDVLNILSTKSTDIPLAFLVDNHFSFKRNLDLLKFKPAIYSPHFKLVDQDLIDFCKKERIQLIVWTVNEWEDLKDMASRGLDGIITDYPDRALNVLKTAQSK